MNNSYLCTMLSQEKQDIFAQHRLPNHHLERDKKRAKTKPLGATRKRRLSIGGLGFVVNLEDVWQLSALSFLPQSECGDSAKRCVLTDYETTNMSNK